MTPQNTGEMKTKIILILCYVLWRFFGCWCFIFICVLFFCIF